MLIILILISILHTQKKQQTPINPFGNTHMIADLAVEAIRTGTIEPVLRLVDEIRPAGPIIHTCVTLATDQRHRAVLSAEQLIAHARVIGASIVADAVLAGGVTLALVDVVLTVIALEALLALAGVAADAVHAGALVARIALALVDVRLAVLARHALHTDALVPGMRVLRKND